MCRCDRSISNSVYNNGGGVLVAVKSKYSSERVHVADCLNVEMVTVKIAFSNFNCYVCCVYIPSGASQEKYNLYVNVFSSLFSTIKLSLEDKFFILGDFF